MRGLAISTLAAAAIACGSSGSTTTTSGSGTGGGASTGTGTGAVTTGGTSGGGVCVVGTKDDTITGTPIGLECDQNHACPAGQSCTSINGGQDYFCTIQCAQGGDGKSPPDGGEQLCAACPTQANGNASCDLVTQQSGKYVWSCGLLCSSDCSCPGAMTCNSNGICQ